MVILMNKLEYKGYTAIIEYSAEDSCLFGKVLGLADLIVFDAESASEIEKSFHDALDGYLELCKELGKEPDKQYSGSFNVRVSPELHKQISVKASTQGKNLNQYVKDALEESLNEKPSTNSMQSQDWQTYSSPFHVKTPQEQYGQPYGVIDFHAKHNASKRRA